MIMPCPKCAGTGTELATVRSGYFNPPTAMFRCHRCAFRAYGEAALRAAGQTQETKEEPKMEGKKLCRWQPCDKGPVSYGWCDTHRSRIVKRGRHPNMTDAEAAAFVASWAPQLTPPPPYRGKKSAPKAPEAPKVDTVYYGPAMLQLLAEEAANPTPEPQERPAAAPLPQPAPEAPYLTESELVRRMGRYEELRKARLEVTEWEKEVTYQEQKLQQAREAMAEAAARVDAIAEDCFGPLPQVRASGVA